MTDEDKEPYRKAARKDQARFARERAVEHHAAAPSPAVVSDESVESALLRLTSTVTRMHETVRFENILALSEAGLETTRSTHSGEPTARAILLCCKALEDARDALEPILSQVRKSIRM